MLIKCCIYMHDDKKVSEHWCFVVVVFGGFFVNVHEGGVFQTNEEGSTDRSYWNYELNVAMAANWLQKSIGWCFFILILISVYCIFWWVCVCVCWFGNVSLCIYLCISQMHNKQRKMELLCSIRCIYSMDQSNETQREWKCNGKVIMKMDEKLN